MQKIACIFSFKESSWVSCQKIVFNLHAAYGSLENTEILNFNYGPQNERGENRALAQEIYDAEPDIISIIDHKPHPIFIINAITALYTQDKRPLPKFVFHVFGDFTLYYPLWDNLQKVLKGAQVQFIVASPRQKILLDRMLSGAESLVCPFPVNSEEFFHAPKLRQACRSAWGIEDKDFAFVFTGRLSRQKRIKTLITTFNLAFEKNPNAHLFVYGHSDNLGDPFMAKHDVEGEYFRSFFKTYRSLAPEVQNRIHFMGQVPNKELLPVYQGADAFINLSVHNDEDYGMSVAEAECSGLPCIMTDWGGLAAFAHSELPAATCYIPVAIGKRSKIVRKEEVVKAMNHAITKFKQVDRSELSRLAQEKFGVEAAHSILEDSLKKPFPIFTNFSELFSRASNANLNAMYRQPYRTRNNYINKLYREIYSAYVRPN